MALQNGNALFVTLKKNSSAMRIRHFIPFLFVLSLIFFPVISLLIEKMMYIFAMELIMYIILDYYFSFEVIADKHSAFLFILFPMFHISYGIGSLLGLMGIDINR